MKARGGHLAKLIVPACLLLYAVGQWTFASKIGKNVVFHRGHVQERVEFEQMVGSVETTLLATCNPQVGINRLLMDDTDVLYPYLASSMDSVGSCQLVRETLVTPFSASQLQACGSLLIREVKPPLVPDEKSLDPSDDQSPQSWQLFQSWSSTDARYSYRIFRHACSTGAGS